MSRRLTLVVDLDILLCRSASDGNALDTPAGPAPTFTFTTSSSAPVHSSTSGSSSSNPPQTNSVWLRPGVRRFLLAVQPHADTVLLLRHQCCSSYGGGEADAAGYVEELARPLLTAALACIDPDGQFFGIRVFLASQSAQSGQGRASSFRRTGAAAAAPKSAASPALIHLQNLADLDDHLKPQQQQSPTASESALAIVSTANRALYGNLSDVVIECQTYRKEYGMYDDVLDCLANVVTGSLLEAPSSSSVPAALRRLGLLHAKLQPSPVMQAVRAQIAMRKAGCMQQGQGQGAGEQQQPRRQQQQQQGHQRQHHPQPQAARKTERQQTHHHHHQQQPYSNRSAHQQRHPNQMSPPPPSIVLLSAFSSSRLQSPPPPHHQQQQPASSLRCGGLGSSGRHPSSPSQFQLPSIPEQPQLETSDASETFSPEDTPVRARTLPSALSHAANMAPPQQRSLLPPAPHDDSAADAGACEAVVVVKRAAGHRKAWSEGNLVLAAEVAATAPSKQQKQRDGQKHQQKGEQKQQRAQLSAGSPSSSFSRENGDGSNHSPSSCGSEGRTFSPRSGAAEGPTCPAGGNVLGWRPKSFPTAAKPRMTNTRRVSGSNVSCEGASSNASTAISITSIVAAAAATVGRGVSGGGCSSDGRGSDGGSISIRSSFGTSSMSLRSGSTGWASLRGSGFRFSITSSRGSSPRSDPEEDVPKDKGMAAVVRSPSATSRLSSAASAMAAKTSRLFARLLGSRRSRRGSSSQCKSGADFDSVFDVNAGLAEVGEVGGGGGCFVSRRFASDTASLAGRKRVD